jgi:NAD-dependent SIR2 family protein deacetylase
MIYALHCRGQLQHVYTQNIDGLQTRDFPELIPHVCELHGSNQRVRCNFCRTMFDLDLQVLDEEFLSTGLVPCSACVTVGKSTRQQSKLLIHIP